MKPKTLSKIISFYFILTFAFLAGIGSIMDMPNKLIPDLDVLLDQKANIANQPLGTPSDIIPPSTPVEFYMDPNFYFKSTVGGIVGYILRWVLDFISIGLRTLAGKFR